MAKKLTEAVIKKASTMEDYKRLAKVADQRMKRLEDIDKDKTKFSGVKQFAYKKAQSDLLKWTTKSQVDMNKPLRFNVKISEEQLQARLNIVKKFLLSKSSTETGIKEIQNKKFESFKNNPKYEGLDITKNQYAMFFETGLAKKLFEKYDSSDLVMKVLTIIKKSNAKTVKEFNKAIDVLEIKESDEVAVKFAKEIMKDYGKDIKKVFK